jgi:hypothetical protein
MLEFLKKYWFLITSVITVSAAWGGQQIKINNIEEAVKVQAQNQAAITELKEKSARQDERTQRMLDNQAQQQRLLEILIQEQRQLNRSITKPK